MAILLDSIPGLAAKVAKASRLEQERRENAYLSDVRRICGHDVRLMNARHWIMLDAAGVPFLAANVMGPIEVAIFLWVLSPAWKPGKCPERDEFLKRVAKVKLGPARKQIAEYVDETFMDGGGSRGSSSKAPPATSFAAALVDLVASEYGWREGEILDMPLVRLFQYLRRIDMRTNPKAAVINPLSDRARRLAVKAHLAKLSKKGGNHG
jgi:hypothetical protein